MHVVLLVLLSILSVVLPGCGGGGGQNAFAATGQVVGPTTSPVAVTVTASYASPAISQIVGGGVAVDFGTASVAGSQPVTVQALLFSIEFSGGALPSHITNLQAFVPGRLPPNPLNSGSAAVNPSTTAALLVFDKQEHGQAHTFQLRANVSAAIPVGASIKLRLREVIAFAGTGSEVLSVTITPDSTQNLGVTVAASPLSISQDSSSPGYFQLPVGENGATDVTVLQSKLRSSTQTQSLQTVDCAILSGKAQGIMEGSLWDGNVRLGSFVFTGASTHATCTLVTQVTLRRDQDKLLTVRLDVGGIAPNMPGYDGAFVQIAIVGARATGLDSGELIQATGRAEANGFRTYRTVPTVARDNSLPTQGVSDGRLMRTRVTAHRFGSVGLAKTSYRIQTIGCTVLSVNQYGYEDPVYSLPCTSVQTNGQYLAAGVTPTSSGLVEIFAETSTGVRSAGLIDAGTTGYLELRGLVVPNPGATNWSVTVTMLGDTQPFTADGMGVASQVGQRSRFVWSPSTFGNQNTQALNWANGFGVSGLSPDSQTRIN